MKTASVSDQSQTSDADRTAWTEILRAGDSQLDRDAESLHALTLHYQPAILQRLHGPKWRFDPHSADALCQKFLEHKLLSRALFAKANPQRGAFRNFLRTAVDRFVLDQLRSPEEPLVFAGRCRPDDSQVGNLPELPADNTQDAFDTLWVRGVLQRGLARMLKACQETERMDLWKVLEARVLNQAPLTDVVEDGELLAQRLGLSGPKQLANTLVTAKRMLRRMVEEQLRTETGDDLHLESEIREMRQIVAAGFSLNDPQANDDVRSASTIGSWIMVRLTEELDDAPIVVDRTYDLQDVLNQSLAEFLGCRSTLKWEADWKSQSLRQMFVAVAAPTAVWQAIRNRAKEILRTGETGLATEVISVLYFASQAADVVSRSGNLLHDQHTVVAQGLQGCLARDWLDPDLRDLFKKWLALATATTD